MGIKDLLWFMGLMAEIGVEVGKPKLMIDNQAAIQMIKEARTTPCSKHIDIKHHFIGDVKDGTVELEFTPTKDQLADVMTKALGTVLFEDLRERIGIKGGC